MSTVPPPEGAGATRCVTCTAATPGANCFGCGRPVPPEDARKARETAIARLSTITGETTPERRRAHAEWIVDALLDVLRAEQVTPPAEREES